MEAIAGHGHDHVPDGGWGWVIVFASFWINGLTLGQLKTFGVLLPALNEEYDSTVAFTAWINGIAFAITFAFAPAAAVFCNMYGFRKVTMVGALLAGFGISTCSLVGRIEWMFLTYGIMFGSGCALLVVPALFILSQYFHKRLSIASGFALSGTSVGSFILPPCIEAMTRAGYDVRMVMLVCGGVTLNLIVFASLYRPPPKPKKPRKLSLNPASNSNAQVFASNSAIGGARSKDESAGGLSVKSDDNSGVIGLESDHQAVEFKVTVVDIKITVPEGSTSRNHNEKAIAALSAEGNASDLDRGAAATGTPSVPLSMQKKDEKTATCVETTSTASSLHTRDEKNSTCVKTFSTAPSSKTETEATGNPVKKFHFSIFRSGRYLLCVVVFMLFYYTYASMFILIPIKAKEVDDDRALGGRAVSLLSLIEVVFSPVWGVLYACRVFRRPNARLFAFAVDAVCSSVLLFFAGQVEDRLALMTWVAVNGLLLCGAMSPLLIVLVDTVGPERVGSALGAAMLAQSLVLFVGPMATGALVDRTGSANASFYVMAASMMVSGLTCAVIPCVTDTPSHGRKDVDSGEATLSGIDNVIELVQDDLTHTDALGHHVG